MKELKEFYKNWKFYAIVFAVLLVGSAVINSITDKDKQDTSSSINSSKEETVFYFLYNSWSNYRRIRQGSYFECK
mgnify:CR=1 FL=1